MLYRLTRFDNARTTIGQTFEHSLETLAACLTAEPFVNPGNKTEGAAFTPGWFDDNRRSKKGFQRASCLVVDVDGPDHGALSDTALLSILEFLKNQNVAYILYSTYNGGLRIVYPLTRDCSPEEYTKLYDRVAAAFPVMVDKTSRTADRIHFLPQVPSADAAARHMSEAVLDAPLLAPDAQLPAATQADSVFTGLKLSQVKIGRLVATLDDLTSALAVTTTKQEDLNKYCFGLACDAARRNEDKGEFALRLWASAEAGLRQNPNPVENWKLALDTVERAVEQGYARVDSERDEAAEMIPPAIIRKVESAIASGDLTTAGATLGKFSNDILTPEAFSKAFKDAIEASDGIVSVPDALAQFRAALSEAARHEWQRDLALDKNGDFDGSDRNIDIVLRDHPDVRGRLTRNVRSAQGRAYTADMPWGSPAGPVTNIEADHNRFFMWITSQDVLGRGAASMPAFRARARLDAAFEEVADYDPFREYLRGLAWDGKERLGSWFADIGGDASEYAQLVCRKFLIAAVARTFSPGVEVDNVLVLWGGQGRGKSRTLRALCPEYNGTLNKLDEREVPQRMSRWVIAIIDEIERWGTKRASGELKEFVTATSAESRAAYGRSDKVYLRRAVLVGATNHEDFLYDETGARRWWRVAVTESLDVDKLVEMRDQLWAEATRAYFDGEVWWLNDAEQMLLAEPEQASLAEDVSPESEHLREVMEYCPPANVCRLREPPVSRNGRLPVVDGQVVENKLKWVTLTQAAAILQSGGFRNDARTVKDAIRNLKLRRNKKTNRYSRCGKQ